MVDWIEIELPEATYTARRTLLTEKLPESYSLSIERASCFAPNSVSAMRAVLPISPPHDRLTRMVTRLVVVFGLLLACACDSPPTAPTPPPTPPPANPSPRGPQARVTGSVTDEGGLPIAGASISTVPNAVSTLTNADGFYELSGSIGSSYGLALFATRDGYERNYQWVPSAAEAVQNFRLRRELRIASGAGLTVVVDSEDTLYGSSEQYRARRVRVVAQGTGNLEVEGSSSTGHPVRLSDSEYEYFPCCPTRLDLAVSTGQEVSVHVLIYFLDEPEEFSITTRLGPPK